MPSEIVIRASHIGKCFQTYDCPQARLKQGLYSLASRFAPSARLRERLRLRAHACARHFWALRDVNVEIGKGETIGIIGRNGSGKSTLLQIICGTLAPTIGEVEIKGRVAALLELGSGFDPQFTGRENVYLNGQLLGLSQQEIAARFDDIAAFADIGHFIDQPVKTYSSGMYVRLAFAVIAHVDADILVIDEALAVGDAFFTQKCMRFLRRFMQGGTILFVSHDTAAVKSLCSRAIWIDQGIVRHSGRAKEVCDKYLQAFYETRNSQAAISAPAKSSEIKAIADIKNIERKDARLDWLNRTPWRNDIRLFEFRPEAECFGNGAARVLSVELCNEDGQPLCWVVGGENVTLTVRTLVLTEMYTPIVGFYFKDRLGQILFGDNTYLSYVDRPLVVLENEEFEAAFSFRMPVLPKGDYSICVAVAEGSSESHVPAHWINEALILRSEVSGLTTGLVGIPIHEIRMQKMEEVQIL